jgi:glycosyltransferase involved in cell wall biosynthesis
MIRILGLALYGPQAASTRYRLGQYADGLRMEGIEIDLYPLLANEYILKTLSGGKYSHINLICDYLKRVDILLRQKIYNAAIVNAELFPFVPGLIESRLLRIPFIYDFDDAFFLKYRQERFRHLSFLLQNKFDPIVTRAAAVLAGNNYLADYARRLNPQTFLLPTVVDTERYVCRPRRRDHAFTVGWIGSPSTSVYLSQLRQPLSRLGAEGPVRFVIVGGRCEAIEDVEVINLPWEEATEIGLINSFDVGVMPLFDDEWARGKCAFKLIQYMACGVPVVASTVGANVDVVTSDCGLLAKDDNEWLCALRRLRDDPRLRQSLGRAGRERIEQHYSLRIALPLMTRVIKSVAGKG